MSEGKRIDHYFAGAVGEQADLGWGIAVLNANETVTRTCKSCGVSVTTPVSPRGEVARAAIHHHDGCAFMAGKVGNNPTLS